VLLETNAGDSKTKRAINHVQSKHRIHVILESEQHTTVPAPENIRSQIVKKEMTLFVATGKRSNNLEKTIPCLNYN